MTRKEERTQAFIIIFEKLFNDDKTVNEIIEDAVEARTLDATAFAIMLANMSFENVEEIDAIIDEFSIGWKKARISKVSLAILRLAICEMLFVDSVPVSVSINEAVELAKTFATTDDAAFINGILGSAAKSLESKKVEAKEVEQN